MRNTRKPSISKRSLCCRVLLISAMLSPIGRFATAAAGNFSDQAQPEPAHQQSEIEKQKLRLNATEIEERRDAVMHLGALRRAEASRAAIPALYDPSPIVRVAATVAVSFLPGEESTKLLLPLLNDEDPFVRQEVAYALGSTRNRRAVAALMEHLTTDKEDGVRSAAAV